MYERGKLTDRQRRFADLYLELGNAQEAARRAGFAVEYAQRAKRQPAVQAYLAERRKELPHRETEVLEFLTSVMRGEITASELQTEAGYELGKRIGLWSTKAQMRKRLIQ